jgi:cysteine synthase
VHAALEQARQIASGVIVTILPDAGDRYLGTALWET